MSFIWWINREEGWPAVVSLWEDRRRIYGGLRWSEVFVTMRTAQKRQVCVLLPKRQHLDCTVRVSVPTLLYIDLTLLHTYHCCTFTTQDCTAHFNTLWEVTIRKLFQGGNSFIWALVNKTGEEEEPWMCHVLSMFLVCVMFRFLGESQRPWGVKYCAGAPRSVGAPSPQSGCPQRSVSVCVGAQE